MKNKLLFSFAFVATIVLHAYVLQTSQITQNILTVEPQKKVSTIINLQRVAIKTPPPAKEVLPPPPEPMVEEILSPMPKKIKKNALEKVKKKKVVKKKSPKKKKVKKKKNTKEKKRKPPKKVQRVASKSQLSSPKKKALKNTYLSQVRKKIEQYKTYPRIAKRMKQQGTAHVKFTISSNGKIRHISLAKKCPYKKLNQAAVSILKQIGSFSPIPKELEETYFSLTVPITYKITN